LRAASLNSDGFASANHGRPTVAATSHPGDFKGPGVTAAGTSARYEHENGMTGPATGGAPHENRGPAITQGKTQGSVSPVDNHRPRERNPAATHVQPHTPPAHQQRVATPKAPREAPHREPPRRTERPQPHPQAPRPQPHPQAPRPQPHPQPHGGGGGGGRPHEEHKR